MERQRYHCHGCHRRFDDLTGPIFAGHHQPLKTWILCLYLMGLSLSNRQIAKELELDRGTVQEHNVRVRGKALLGALIGQPVAPPRNAS